MEERDLTILARLVKDYPIQDVMKALEKAFAARADELSDLDLGHSGLAKELSLAAWHLHLFRNQ
jgi:hypothetical protein